MLSETSQEFEVKRPHETGKDTLGWFVCFVVLGFFNVVLSWFDNPTELIPSQDNVTW